MPQIKIDIDYKDLEDRIYGINSRISMSLMNCNEPKEYSKRQRINKLLGEVIKVCREE